jgi:O-antigen/teichoic acid export membrane protein
LRALGRRVRVSFRRAVWRRYRAIWSDVAWSLVGTTTWAVQGQALVFLVAAIVGPAAYAPLAVGMVLFTPLRPAISAFINVFRPDFGSALAQGQIGRLRVMMLSITVLILLSSGAVGGAIWLGWPLLETYLLAGKFDNAPMPLIVALSGIAAAVYSAYNVPLALVQGAGEFRPVALATTYGAVVGLVSVTILLAVTSVAWSLAGFIAGEAVCGLCLWISAQSILRERAIPIRTHPATTLGAAELRT